MRNILQFISWVALVVTLLPSILFCMGSIELQFTQWLMLLATIIWFVITPLWMGKDEPTSSASD